MYDILLLQEMPEGDSKIKDYLCLGGCCVNAMPMEELDFHGDSRHFDLIVVECDQLELCIPLVEGIREHMQIPIIILTEQDDEWEKIRLFKLGIDDYIVKPYWQGELLARIQAHIGRYKRLTRPFGMIKVDNLEINAFSRTVMLDGKQVEFRLKEFEVLLFLAQHMDEVVCKQDIYEAIWRDNLADPFYNHVAVQVKKVREKIEKDINNPRFIETVWGVGYRFRS